MLKVNTRAALRLVTALGVLAGTTAGPAAAHETANPGRGDDRAAAGASVQYVDRRLDELRRLMAQLDAKEQDVRAGIAEAEPLREQLAEQLGELSALLGEAQGHLNVADARLAEVQADLERRTAELERAERALEATVAKLEARAVTVYKHGRLELFELVLRADDLSDIVRRFAVAVRLANADNDRVRQLEHERAVIERSWVAVNALREERAHEAAHVRTERNRVSSVKREVDSQHASVSGELRAQYEELGDIEQERKRYVAETRQLEAESAAIRAFLAGKTDQAPTVSRKGMSWPVRGPVTSGYGWRTHPIFNERRFHAGIDIGAPAGSPVGAAASGQVIFAGAKTGYGNHVIVYHGGGISTLYAHLSSIGAPNGSQVTRGQRIGGVGCTGYCTGPHLHFEVRVDGDPVDPMGWLP